MKEISTWYNSLDQANKRYVEWIARESMHAAIFGIFAMLDGARVVFDENERKGKLDLYYVPDEGEQTLLSPDLDYGDSLLDYLGGWSDFLDDWMKTG
ncbi:MAG: hypothetical protein AAGI17_11070 [Planctomycetota bacterium]